MIATENWAEVVNMLIVGANKCGTTSLHSILSAHPSIFMSPSKEPHFLSWECWNEKAPGPGDEYIYKNLVCKNLEDYRKEFKSAGLKEVIGESSTDTFYYAEKTIPKIQKLLGDPCILIMLRNPAQRAFSAYKHLWRDGREQESFIKGLELEKMRIEQGFEYMWHYKNGGFYADKTRLFLRHFSRVKIVFFEDFIQNTQVVVDETLDFLKLQPVPGLPYKKAYNTSGDPRIKWLRDLIRKPTKARNALKPLVPSGVRKWLRNDFMEMTSSPMKLEPSLHDELLNSYRHDIEDLEFLLARKCPWSPQIIS
jgi:hypothetical protein